MNEIEIYIGTEGALVLSELLKTNTTLAVLKMDSMLLFI